MTEYKPKKNEPMCVKKTSGTYMQQFHEPHMSYMNNKKLRSVLIDELSQLANSHFSQHLDNLSSEKFDFTTEIEKFMMLYAIRPFKDNTGGSGFHNAFWLFLTARVINPVVIIESGVWKGHTSWLLEQACPKAQFLGFDIDLNRLEYTQGNAKFYEHDWTKFDFQGIDLSNALIFFDCHVNHARRIIESQQRGIQHILFDDNPPAHKLYAYKNPGFPTANMLDSGIGLDLGEISWHWQGRKRTFQINTREADKAKKLIKRHEVFPDVAGPTRYGGFSFLTYVQLKKLSVSER